MKITMEVNDAVAAELIEWAQNSFGSEFDTIEKVIQELTIDALVAMELEPNEYSVETVPEKFWALFSPKEVF